MRYPAEQKIDVYAQAVRGLTLLEPHPEKVLKYLDFIDIYTGLDGNELQLYQERYPEEAKQMSIREFEKLSGVLMVLNTSFNENEPVVCKPE